jgi:hypothetical protein
LTDQQGRQSIGPIRHSSRVDIEQRSQGPGTQEVSEVDTSHDIRLRQMQGQAQDLSAEAADLLRLLASAPLTADDLRPLIDEPITAQTITMDTIDAARLAGRDAQPAPELTTALNALATAVSITAGGIAVAAISNPVILAVIAPLTLGLAGIVGLDVVRKTFERIRHRLTSRGK